MSARTEMITAVRKLQDIATETKTLVDVDRLYLIAAQLTIAQCSNQGVKLTDRYPPTDEHVQGIFAEHFAFLVEHSIDILNLEKEENGTKTR